MAYTNDVQDVYMVATTGAAGYVAATGEFQGKNAINISVTTSGDKATYLCGILPTRVRSAVIYNTLATVTTTGAGSIGGVTNWLWDRRVLPNSDVTKVTGVMTTVSGAWTSAKGHYTENLNVALAPGQELVLILATGNSVTGSLFTPKLLIELAHDMPANATGLSTA